MVDAKPPAPEQDALPTPKFFREDAKAPKPLKPPNPMWKYLGFGENFRPKLPSRNWTIFLTLTGTFTAAVIYDKRETRRAQRKWCKLVEHISKEPLNPREMPRKLTVFLEGPPTDGLRVAQDHFKEYVKPILVASGLDWEFVQGRKEGDVRAELAEKIRNQRLPPGQRTEEDVVVETRRGNAIREFEGPRGDIVIGRHTWKEYVRGLHEGWLGPLNAPPKLEPVEEKPVVEEPKGKEMMETAPGITLPSEPREADSLPPSEQPGAASPEKPKKPSQPAPFISVAAYPTASTPPDLPLELEPTVPISFPHILGFLNTPKRLYRFLNRRVLADSIGRDTAAIILSTYRPYHATSTSEEGASFTSDSLSSSSGSDSDETTTSVPQTAEIQAALLEEEKEWHKNARVRVPGEPERTWLEPVILDPRIASRMRRAELTAEDEAKVAKIVIKEEEIEGWIKGGLRSFGRNALRWMGFGKEKVKNGQGDEDLG
ncbi:hypothetical protein QTJ16_004141 [Diplocarpon rosae]|uniref:Mitochondrial import inner membrane translocase subunit TIM54 n=1 Tax=Diplocarpon rosae TaxID=946125 RepID=A0AAD9T0F7_9HELO|nr:hypothetical protein QTJ16_004141 [Diplocarpon rosae]PBP22555.1 TIM complex component Tim54 [Diplocarpon rosae]